MTTLTNKQLAARNEGYSPNRAGEQLLKGCNEARATLYARLSKPGITDEAAYEGYVLQKIAIRNMDHNELCAALKA